MKKTLLLLSVFLLTGVFSALAATDVHFMSQEELKEKLNSENIAILDTRSEKDWSTSQFKIPGAIRADWNKIEEWSANLLKNNTLVLYCA